jgi:hypothetical protein
MAASDGVPHTFPASVIGGFGVPTAKRPNNLRYNEVAVRLARKPGEILSPMSASNVSKVRNEYALEEPPPGVDRNMIDALWDAYEPHLPAAIRSLERGRPSQDEWRAILGHVHAQGVRSPRFRDRAKEYLQVERGVTDPTWDQVQAERVVTLANTPKLLATYRFAIVRRPSDGPRFIANDMGYATPLQDMEFGVKCLIFPLSPEVAVLAAIDVAKPSDEYQTGPMEDLTMTPATVDVVNEASWRLTGIACVFGHPDDREYLLNLDRNRELIGSALGPYRGTCDVGLADWAVMDQRASRLTILDWKGISPNTH